MESRSMIFEHNFLFVRLILFIILVCVSLLAIGFAAWTIASTGTNDLPLGAVILTINTPVTLVSICGAFVAILYPKLSTAHVKHELVWSLTLSVIDLAAMLLATIHPPASALSPINWNLFVSYILFQVAGWSSTVLLAVYATALAVATISHHRIYPNLLTSPVHTVPWFQKLDIENRQVRVSMFFPPDLDTKFACRSPSWEGRFAGVRMHDGPFAVLTAKKAAEETAGPNNTDNPPPQPSSSP